MFPIFAELSQGNGEDSENGGSNSFYINVFDTIANGPNDCA